MKYLATLITKHDYFSIQVYDFNSLPLVSFMLGKEKLIRNKLITSQMN